MIIKTYTAESAAAALKRVRTELGPGAVVLKTKQVQPFGPNRIEVTACLDKPADAPAAPRTAAPVNRVASRTAAPSAPAFPTVQKAAAAPVANDSTGADSRFRSLEEKINQLTRLMTAGHANAAEPELVKKYTELLKDNDLPESIITLLRDEMVVPDKGDDAVAEALEQKLIALLSERTMPQLSFKPGDRVAIIGPSGCGKSAVMGKLASRLVYQEKRSVKLVSLDTVKIGAYEETQSYADLLGTPIESLANGLLTADSRSIVLIDTPALPATDEKLESLAQSITLLQPTHCLLVVSALTRSSDIATQCKRMAAVHPTHLVITMLDLTRRWGGLLAATESVGLKIAYVTNTPGGIGTVNAPDPARFARTLLNREVSRD